MSIKERLRSEETALCLVVIVLVVMLYRKKVWWVGGCLEGSCLLF